MHLLLQDSGHIVLWYFSFQSWKPYVFFATTADRILGVICFQFLQLILIDVRDIISLAGNQHQLPPNKGVHVDIFCGWFYTCLDLRPVVDVSHILFLQIIQLSSGDDKKRWMHVLTYWESCTPCCCASVPLRECPTVEPICEAQNVRRRYTDMYTLGWWKKQVVSFMD